MLSGRLITGQVLPTNPAAVRDPKRLVKTGKPPILKGAEWRKLLDFIPDHDTRRSAPSALSAIDEHRNFRMREHFNRLAAQDHRGDAATPVRGDQDQIAPSRRGGIDDRLIHGSCSTWSVSQPTPANLAAAETPKRHRALSRRKPPHASYIDRGVFELAWRDRKQMERLGDRHCGNLGADLLGEEDALLDGLRGEVRPVGRDKDILKQVWISSAWCFFYPENQIFFWSR